MDVIQCEDLSEYLIWKWRPNKDAEVGQSRKENTIRNGSPLIVKDGQAAVFQYPQGGYDIFIDQHTTKLSTDNMPVLAGLVGTLFAGGSPCPAQIYFVNLQTSVKVPFYVPDIRLTPPSQQTYGDMNLEFSDLRVSVKGVVTMAVPRDAESIRVLLRSFGGNLEHFWLETIKDEAAKYDDVNLNRTNQFPAALVVDIATDPNGVCLEVAIGNPNTIYVACMVDGQVKICSGSLKRTQIPESSL